MAAESVQDFKPLFQQIGISLNIWAKVESELCRVFCACFDSDNASPADQAFWAVISFEAKLAMVGAVIAARFNHKPDIRTDWGTIRDALVTRNKLRNKIAHGTVLRMRVYKKGKPKPSETFLSPYHYARQYKDPPSLEDMLKPTYDPRPKERLKLADIEQAARAFSEMRDRVQALWTKVDAIARREAAEMREGKALPRRQVDL